MRKKVLTALLALTLCLSLAVGPASAASAQFDQEQVYRTMTALEAQYPEGTRWTNDNFYQWQGGVYSGGYGCVAFAFLLSDAAFGDAPARVVEGFSLSDVRVGDILRVNQDTHSVIVLEVRPDELVIAEGNYNSSVHWGRTLSGSEVAQADYLMTRYPESEAPAPSNPEEGEDIPASGTAYASSQTVTVDGRPVEFQMYALKDAAGNETNYIKLRDLAYVLSGTPARFSVGYDGAISVTSGQTYEATGTEMTTPYSGDRSYAGGAQSVRVNGALADLTAITLFDGNGGGYTYFKLRDLGEVLGFTVGWSAEAGVFVNTEVG